MTYTQLMGTVCTDYSGFILLIHSGQPDWHAAPYVISGPLSLTHTRSPSSYSVTAAETPYYIPVQVEVSNPTYLTFHLQDLS